MYRAATPVAEERTIDIEVTVDHVSMDATDPDGIILSIGEDDLEGARLEFSPYQAQDLQAVLTQFITGNIVDPTTGMNPLRVDETGEFHELKP
jgi:hypothetical protein